jgi:hypothetical protein
MSFSQWVLLTRRASLFVCAVVLAAGFASAQSAVSDHAGAASVSAGESSSDSLPVASLADSDDSAALPSAPVAAGSGAAQEPTNSGLKHRLTHNFTFEGGGGFNAPISDSVTWGGNLTIGGGYNLSEHLALLAEYQFIADKLPGVLIAEAGATGGYVHIWSLTVDPVIDLYPKKNNDLYITGGGGFYRKVTNFTDPQEAEYCEYYYCEVGVENEVVGHFSSNQGGFNIGGGYMRRFGGMYGDSRTKLFAEFRYLDVLSPATTTNPNGLGTTTVAAGTRVVPITLGIRW